MRNIEIVSDVHCTASDTFESATDRGAFHGNIGELKEELDTFKKKLEESGAKHNAAQTALVKFQTDSSETLQKAKEDYQNNLLSIEIKHKESSQAEAKKLQEAHALEVAKLKDDMESDAKQQLEELNKKVADADESKKKREAEKSSSSTKISDVQEQLQKAQNQLAAVKESHKKSLDELKSATKAVEDKEAEIEKATTAKAKIEEVYKEATDELKSRTLEITEKMAKLMKVLPKMNAYIENVKRTQAKSEEDHRKTIDQLKSSSESSVSKLQKNIDAKNAELEEMKQTKAKIEEDHKKLIDELKSSIESCKAESQMLVIERATDCRALLGKIGELKEELDCKTTIICICITTMILLLVLLLLLLKFSMPIFVGMMLLLLLQVPQVLLLAIPIQWELLAILDFGAFLGNIGELKEAPELLTSPQHKKTKLIHAPVSVLTIVSRNLKKRKKKRKRE